uniref:peptide chain release factor N(5)-glutamine methyltransferase n=1 Tax=Takifugu rubripes TaxID=31033 RepID=A0A674MYV2_TAKRU
CKHLFKSHVEKVSQPTQQMGSPQGRITTLEALDIWKRHFIVKGVSEPEHSSSYIIAHVLGAKTVSSFVAPPSHACFQVCFLTAPCFFDWSRMPVQYVIEEWEFRDLTLKMRPPVFIPRPETEELVELVLSDLKTGTEVGADTQQTCLEVGCGSGAVSLSLLKGLPQLQVFAVDQSQDAVDLTAENAVRLGLQDRLQVHQLDVMTGKETLYSLCSPVTALVSNPPYLFSEDMKSLEPEISRFEDLMALDGGEDGLNIIKNILSLAPQILSNQGRVYLEVEPRHPAMIQHWVEANEDELRYVETRHDITGRLVFLAQINKGLDFFSIL